MELSRRDLVKLGLLGSAALYLPVERVARAKDQRSLAKLPTPYTYAFSRPPELDLRAAANGGTPVTSIRMAMQQGPVPMLGPAPWPATNVWAYTIGGKINPTIHVDKGQPLEIPVSYTHLTLPTKA